MQQWFLEELVGIHIICASVKSADPSLHQVGGTSGPRSGPRVRGDSWPSDTGNKQLYYLWNNSEDQRKFTESAKMVSSVDSDSVHR